MPVVQRVPAQVLSQRPDLAAAERELAAASADIGVREAERFPRLSLLGNIGPLSFETAVASISATSWSIGPSLSLPIFDGGRRAANVETAKIAYEVAATNYRTQARRAVREVEEALVRLDSLNQREREGLKASKGYHESLQAAQARYKFGLASILDLEETRRLSVNADNILANVRRERVNAYIALYRAVGGGWDAKDLAAVVRTVQENPREILTGKLQ
jgi:outer membrane protein TolC